nr:MAG TPA: hypothetical protein [Caudoviricetes sp.]
MQAVLSVMLPRRRATERRGLCLPSSSGSCL